MSAATVTIIVLGLTTYALKAFAPLVMSERSLPGWIDRLATVLPAPLLAALVVTSTAVSDKALVLDARMAGVIAAAVALRLKLPFVVVVVVAAAATAAVRALS
ncbi:MAG: AzlD domain-containing protein [Acidimicrobiales bacterium]